MSRQRMIMWSLTALAFMVPRSASAQRCGVERWAVKTGTDGDAQRVDLAHPKDTTIAGLIALSPPHPPPAASRVRPTETTVYVINATLTDYKFQGGSHGDSDYHLVLQDSLGNTMIAEIPSPACVGSGSPFAAQIAASRQTFDSRFTATSSFQNANIPVRVTGVAMFDFQHGQRGVAPNAIELHPILNIVFEPGVPGTDFVVLLSATTIRVPQGGSSSIAVTASPLGGGAAPNAQFTVSDLPSGLTSHFTVGATGTATLAVTASAATPTGTFPLTVTGTAGGRSHTAAVTIEVSAGSQSPGTQEWEYQVISATSEQDVVDQANRLGAQEWEMVSVVRVSGSPSWKAFFKRLKRAF